MKHPLRLLAIQFLLLVPHVPLAAGWEVLHDSEKLRVERRDYLGSDLDEIRGTVNVRASLNALMALLKDDEFNDQWVYRSGGARILQDAGYPQAYVYGIVDAPFPMADRDSVVRFDYKQNIKTAEITIEITNFPDFAPEEDGLVRVPEFGGYWRLRPTGGGEVEVTYQVYGDPGGWIPVWLANRAAFLSVLHTLENIQEVVGQYEGARSEYVMEPEVAGR